MKTSPSTFAATPNEAQRTILNWVRATEQFHQYHCRINEVIDDLQRDPYQRLAVAGSRANLQALLKLRQYMSDVLARLLMDMTESKSARGNDRSATTAKSGQIASHTRLLQNINRKVADELKRLTLPQA